jgi:hypothetical protein
VEIVPKPYAPDTASLRAAARDQVCSECHYSPTQGSACKFPIRCTCPEPPDGSGIDLNHCYNRALRMLQRVFSLRFAVDQSGFIS